ncbi:MAG TPA: hypothetical protein VL137_15310 [Polyangiaceae bacterium]|jgi:hypothetical protein|nr:hypothetical protein [Polyangiaceae bacterium]
MNGSGIAIFELPPNTSPEVASKERDVIRAGAALSASFEEASTLARATIERAATVVRPVLIGVGALGALLLTIRLLRGAERTRRFQSPASTPWLGLARFAVVVFASAAARGVVRHWLDGKPTRIAQRSI